jgi:hypothetical protein
MVLLLADMLERHGKGIRESADSTDTDPASMAIRVEAARSCVVDWFDLVERML